MYRKIDEPVGFAVASAYAYAGSENQHHNTED